MDSSINVTVKYTLVALAFVLAGVYLPFVGLLTSLVWFIPLIFLAVKKGFKHSLVGIVVISSLLAVISSPIEALLFISGQAIIGLVYCELFSNKASFGKLLLGGFIAAVVSALMRIAIIIWGLSYGYSKWLEQMRKVADNVIQIYKEAGVWDQLTSGPITGQELKELMYSFSQTMVNLTPAALVTFSMLTAFFGLLLAIYFLKRKGLWTPEVPSFSLWKLPWPMAWLAILGLASLLLGDYISNKYLLVAGQNLVYTLLPIYFITGLSTGVFYYKKVSNSFFMKMVLLVIIVFNFPLLLVLLLLLGVFDPLIDFRKLNKTK